jgi:hypothetical protein
MNFKKLKFLDWVTIVGVIVSASVMTVAMSLGGCSTPPQTGIQTHQACCKRLDMRMKEMEEFNRYCMMMVFADRKEEDPNVKADIQRRLGLCKYVFGVPRDQDLMSHLEKKPTGSPWRQVYQDFWNPPVSCDPREIHCEEF